MICKICGCEMTNNGGWLACPTCGAVEFGVEEEPKKSESSISDITKELETIENDFDEFLKSFTSSDYKPKEEEETEIPTASVVEEQVKEIKPESTPVIEEETKDIEPEPSPVIEEKPKDIEPEPAPVVEKVQEDIVSAFEENAQDTEDDIISAFEEKAEATESDITSVFDENDDIEDAESIFLTKDFNASPVKSYTFTDGFTPKNAEEDDSYGDEYEVVAEEPAIPDKKRRKEKNVKKKGKEKEDKKKNPLKDTVEFLIPIVAAVIIAFFLKTFIIANAVVPTGSMMETINIQDRIIASRLAYKTETPSRYDIILFYYPDNEEDIFVKRVLGLPGETVTVIDGVVYVTTKHGKTIQTDQSFVNPNETPSGDYGPYYIPEKGEEITVENGYCFAENGMTMGTTDFLDKYCVKNARGNYIIENELYFMIGDNRNNSSDSRMWKNPYVADDKIIGKVIFKYYPSFEKLG